MASMTAASLLPSDPITLESIHDGLICSSTSQGDVSLSQRIYCATRVGRRLKLKVLSISLSSNADLFQQQVAGIVE